MYLHTCVQNRNRPARSYWNLRAGLFLSAASMTSPGRDSKRLGKGVSRFVPSFIASYRLLPVLACSAGAARRAAGARMFRGSGKGGASGAFGILSFECSGIPSYRPAVQSSSRPAGMPVYRRCGNTAVQQYGGTAAQQYSNTPFRRPGLFKAGLSRRISGYIP